MDLYEAIASRRSIRKFTSTPLRDEDVRLILECAMLAPSAMNQQPWQFVLLRDQAMREAAARTSPYTGMAAHAPLVIVVCGDLGEEKAPGYWTQDCAAATQNLLLAARGKGIGAVWCGVHPVREREEYLKKLLKLPDRIMPFALVCLGYTEMKFHKEDRFRADRIHEGGW